MKRFAKLLVMVLVVSLLVVPLAGTVSAQPTQEEVKAAINKGVAWLLDQQNLEDPDDPQYGSWEHWEKVAVTAFAVKKLEHYAVDLKYGLGLDSPFEAPYADQLQAGLNFVFKNAFIMTIDDSDCDCDDDGIGVYFGTEQWRRTYNTGIVLMAICESVETDRKVDVPGSEVDGWTYQEVAQDTLDYLCFGQNDDGGWGYYENDNWSDNSNTGYAVLGLQYAEAAPPCGCGKTIKESVKKKLAKWIEYIQCDPGDPCGWTATDDGGSGYTCPCDWVNILKTGNLLKEMAFVGWDETHLRVQRALEYLHDTWDEPNWDPGWRGSPDGVADYQAMYTTMKGLTSLGIHEFCDPPIDWQADFETVLLEQQLDDGSWPRTNWDYGAKPILSTLWALLTLEKVVIIYEIEVPLDIKPQSCPNPLNVKSKGVLPAAILGTADFDVSQVDPATVQLEGVSPLRWAMEDVATPFEPYTGKEGCDACTTEGPDDYMDLTLKFDKQAIVAALGDVSDGQCLVLHLTGNLKEEFGGTAIVGEDVVWILKKGKNK